MRSVRCRQNVKEHMNGIMALRFGPEELTRDLGKSSSTGVERTEARMKYRVLLYTTVIGTRGICSSHGPFTGTSWAKPLTQLNWLNSSRNFISLQPPEIPEKKS